MERKKIELRKETWHDATYNQYVINFDWPLKLIQLRLELRGSNSQRSALHIWLDRGVSMWYDIGDPPADYDVYTYFHTYFHSRYYAPACASKVPRFLNISMNSKQHQKRKLQVFPFETICILIDYWLYHKWDAHARTVIRYFGVSGGPLFMPEFVVEQLTSVVGLTNCCSKDLLYINYQRVISVIWTLYLNIKSKKINWIQGTINAKKKWTLKPAVLDAHTYRNGMRNADNE